MHEFSIYSDIRIKIDFIFGYLSEALYQINFVVKKFQAKNISIKNYIDIYERSTNANKRHFLDKSTFVKMTCEWH